MDGSLPSAEAIHWFHSHAFADGETTHGDKPAETLRKEAEVIFRHPVAGKSVLDIGAWDGFFSFEAERQGASRVLATDHFCWSGEGWGTKAGFDYAHAKLGSRVETLDIDVPQISRDTVGTFDVVLFLGVLYHVKDPFTCLERVASVTGEMLVLETETALDIPWPVMRYYEGAELNNDPTNFWAPNQRALKAMLRDIGFRRFEIAVHPLLKANWKRTRVVMHAWR
ncbi:MAG: class I SAM-dependent methyltransferase [Caulobacteraceae bacterium]